MKQNLANLLVYSVQNPKAVFTTREAERFFGQYLDAFIKSKLLIHGQSRNWTECLSCGGTHQVINIDGDLWLACPQPGMEAIKLKADQLKVFKFNNCNFTQLLVKAFALQGEINYLDSQTTLLGERLLAGLKRLFVFTRDRDLSEKIFQNYRQQNPLILFIDPTLGVVSQGSQINLANFIELKAGSLNIKATQALKTITHNLMPEPDDLILDDDIHACRQDKKFYLKLFYQADGSFREIIRIDPTQYAVLNILKSLAKQNLAGLSSKQLANRIARKPRSVTDAITALKNISAKHQTKLLIKDLPDHKYSLHPDLDCMKN